MTTIAVTGGLGSDPDIRFTNSGQAVASASVAVERRWLDKQSDEWKSETTWFRVNVWGQLGENFAASCFKGTRVNVIGRLEVREWEKDGVKQKSVEITADAIGPDLKWATAIVEKTERTEGETPRKAAPKKKTSAYDDDGDLPF